jgi:hypothetical protein
METSAVPVPSLERKALSLYLRDDLLRLLTLTEGATGRPLFYRGVFLADLGLLSPAREAFDGAVSSIPSSDPAWEPALARSLSLSRLDPSLPPAATGNAAVHGRPALDLGGDLIAKGDLAGGLAILAGADPQSSVEKGLATAVTAQALAAEGRSAQALSLLDSFRSRETSATSDLVYLLRGYHHLDRRDPVAARDAFLSLPAGSLFAPEAKLGMAWVQILSGNVPAGVVRFEELLRSHPGSDASRKGALDLALAYRDLGMFDQAGALLTREMRTLTDAREWLESLREEDFGEGRDLVFMLEDAARGERGHAQAWSRSPSFARDFALAASGDPEMARLAALEKGARLLKASAGTLRGDYAEVRARLGSRRAWLAGLDSTMTDWKGRAAARLGRLPSLREDFVTALQRSALRDLASPEDIALLDRLARARERLLFLTNAQVKARGFSSVISELTGAELSPGEQRQLRKIRQEAFDGLLLTREPVQRLEERLGSLEGRVWLGVKLTAAARETDNRRRTETGETTAAATIAAADRAAGLAKELERSLAARAREVEELEAGLGAPLAGRLDSLGARLQKARAARLVTLARERARSIRDQEARVLYTAADIEISKMEDRLRSLQEGAK